jgi:hypothetical protein
MSKPHTHLTSSPSPEGISPTELVNQYYEFPFSWYPYQEKVINELAPLRRSGWYIDMGLGKTAMSFAAALYKTLTGQAERIMIVAPPILLTAWGRFVDQVRDRESGPLDVLIFRGTITQRCRLTLDHDITVIGLQIYSWRAGRRALPEHRRQSRASTQAVVFPDCDGSYPARTEGRGSEDPVGMVARSAA